MLKPIGFAAILVCAILVTMIAGATTQPVPATVPASQPAKELSLDLGGKMVLKLVQIPAGKFLMGSAETEKERDSGETQHEVTISKPFYIGKTHVTVEQFAVFAEDSGYKTDAEKEGRSYALVINEGKFDVKEIDGCSWRKPSIEQKGDHPVVQVSWNDAQAFCAWLSKRSGKTVGLPTEAQWEYACRTGTQTIYPWGDDPKDGKGWINAVDQSYRKKLPNDPVHQSFFDWDDGFVFTSPVATFKANAFGLFDMNGNALQWCQDYYRDFDKGAAVDPVGPAKVITDFRVVRGGCWHLGPEDCRSAFRLPYAPIQRNDNCGFRVVAENAQTSATLAPQRAQ